MGIFGSIGRHLTRPGFGDRLLAAGAIVNGDYGTAGQIRAVGDRQRQEQQQSHAEAQQRAQLEAAAVQMGVPPQQAASLPTNTLAGLVSQQYQPQAESEFTRTLKAAGIDPASPEGRSLYGQRASTMALPAPQMVGSPERGYQWVQPPAPGMPTQQQAASPPQPGAVVGGFRFRGGDPNDRNAWEPAGGAASEGQRPFGASTGSGFPDPFKGPGTVTSGRRTVEGNRLVGGVPNSRHLTGEAVDVVGTGRSALQQYYGPNASVDWHRNHWHVEMPGAQFPYFGRRGTTGLRNR